MKNVKKISLAALFSFLGVGFVASVGTIIGMKINETYNTKIYFANYESYIDEGLKENLESEHNVSYKTYATSEILESKFSNNYDIAIPTTYTAVKMIKENKLQKLDWTKFGLAGVNSSSDALGLFIKPVQNILQAYDFDGDGKNDNLLDYGVPYFLQDVVFGFRNDKYTESDKGTIGSSWKNIFDDLLNKPLTNGDIIAIKDERSIYGISRLYNGETNVNPSSDEDEIEDFFSKYKFLSKFKNNMIFRTDSGDVLNSISHKNGANYSVLYNGDLIYAMQGGDNAGTENEYTDLSFFRPAETLLALDMLVINNKSKNRLEDLYSVVKKVCFDKMESIDESLTLQNFDYINYTPPLQIIYDTVTAEDYWVDPDFPLSPDQITNIIELLKVGDGISNINNLVESTISEKQKINMIWAFEKMLG